MKRIFYIIVCLLVFSLPVFADQPAYNSTVAHITNAGDTYGNFSGSASSDTADELFADIDGNWPSDTTLPEDTVESYIFDSDVEVIIGPWIISANLEVQDDINFSFGNDDDASFVWNSTAARLELRNSSDTPIFWWDLANSASGIVAVTSPEMGLYDVDAAGTDRADEYAGGIGANLTTATEDDEIADVFIYAMADDGDVDADAAKVVIIEWDGSDYSLTMGDPVGDKAAEDLKFDFKTATENEISISSNTSADTLNFNTLNMVTTGTISGAIKMVSDSDGRTLTAAESYGYLHIATGTGTWTLADVCDSATGANICLYSTTAVNVILDCPAEDNFVYEGTAESAGEALDSDDNAGEFICVVCTATNTWTVLGHTSGWTGE